MKATKCDRCGKIFVDGGKKVKIIDKRTSDLCDECMLLVDLEKLLKWMEEIDKKIDNNSNDDVVSTVIIE